MKKIIGILTALVLVLSAMGVAAVAESADAVPQPEGGKKFESNWAMQGMIVSIVYEEEGYRVLVETEDYDTLEGVAWNYSCYYHEDTDTLVSVFSDKSAFVMDEDNLEARSYNVPEYQDMDDENTASVFAINENGRLTWKDGRGDAGADMEFVNIGSFGGAWKNEEAEVDVEISWSAHDDVGSYYVWIQSGSSDADTFVVFQMDGTYNPETGKLECRGPATVYTREGEEYTSVEDDEEYEAFFSWTDGGMLLFETENGIELEPNYDTNG